MRIIGVPRRFVREEWGGTETVLLETGKRIRSAGHDFKIFTPACLSRPGADAMEGIPVERFDYMYPFWGLSAAARREMDFKGGNLFSFSLMRALSREKGLDLIHAHTLKRLGGIVRHAAMKRRIPYVVTLHGGVLDVPESEKAELASPRSGTLEWGRLLGWWVGSRRVLEDASAILCVGREECERMRRSLPDRRIEWMPNGVDSKRFDGIERGKFRARHGLRPDQPMLLTVGRLDPQKNQLGLLRILPELLRLKPNLHLVLIGPSTSASYRREIDAAITGLEKHITLIPGVPPGSPELLEAYRDADIFVLPSTHEPFGIVILEAWAAGLPVAASKVGGIPSFTENGTNILHFDPADPATMITAIGTLLENRDLGGGLAGNGRSLAQGTYDWDRVTGQLLTIYAEVCDANPLR